MHHSNSLYMHNTEKLAYKMVNYYRDFHIAFLGKQKIYSGKDQVIVYATNIHWFRLLMYSFRGGSFDLITYCKHSKQLSHLLN